MKIKTLLLLLVSIPTIIWAQTIVDTEPQNKNIVLEVYTGINCVWCPDGQVVANTISSNNPGRVVHVNIHAGGFANPSAGQPDFRTPFGTAIVNQAFGAGNSQGFPSGSVNRHIFSGLSAHNGFSAMYRNNWTNASNQILTHPSYLNIGATAEIDYATRELTVYVEVYYTGTSPQSTNKLNIALLQNNTVAYQSGGGSSYNHMRRLVHLLTGQWGADITTTSEGSLYSETFTYTIPGNYNSVPALLEDMELAIYVAESTQEIITGI